MQGWYFGRQSHQNIFTTNDLEHVMFDVLDIELMPIQTGGRKHGEKMKIHEFRWALRLQFTKEAVFKPQFKTCFHGLNLTQTKIGKYKCTLLSRWALQFQPRFCISACFMNSGHRSCCSIQICFYFTSKISPISININLILLLHLVSLSGRLSTFTTEFFLFLSLIGQFMFWLMWGILINFVMGRQNLQAGLLICL